MNSILGLVADIVPYFEANRDFVAFMKQQWMADFLLTLKENDSAEVRQGAETLFQGMTQL